MRIGIISYWFNRGQGTVNRYVRSIFENLGYKTFVLARPTKESFDLPGFVDTTDVWNQRDVTHASCFDIPLNEYMGWIKDNSIDVAFFDQNYQFKEIAKIQAMGVKTVGRFVWEAFCEQHVAGAKDAFTIIYSLNRCEQARYAAFGIDSPFIPWGCHPELMTIQPEKRQDAIYFFYPGGYLSNRKPTKVVIEAFSRTPLHNIKLILKAQRKKRHDELIGDVKSLDPRIMFIADDIPSREYYQLFSSCHICLAPSRWEGLGLHLYEAIAFGMPTITNNNPPMNEIVRDEYSGLLVTSHQTGHAKSGIGAYDPDAADLTRAIIKMSEPAESERMAKNMKEMQKFFSWEHTVSHFADLLNF